MSDFWQDRINRELRTLRGEEARESLSVDDQLLHTGHVDQDTVLLSPVSRREWRFPRIAIRLPRTVARRIRLALTS